MLLTWSSAAVVFLSTWRSNIRWRYRTAMLAAAGGLIAYLALALHRLINEDQARQLVTGNVLSITLLGVVIGFWVGFFWRRLMERRARALPERPTGPKSATGPRSSTGPKSPTG